MDLVKHVIACSAASAMLAFAAAAFAADQAVFCGTARWQSLIESAAARFALPEQWLHAVMRAESAGCEMMNGAPTVSSAGAMGLMQLMPSTWAGYREKLQLGDDPHRPSDNILAGSAYLRDLYDRFGWPGAAAAYHAGPARYSEHLSGTRLLPGATLDYLVQIARLTGEKQFDEQEIRTLFVERSTSAQSPATSTLDAIADRLFVPLRHSERHRTEREEVTTDVQE